MAEISIPVQPATVAPAQPAPLQLKMITSPDGLGGQTGAPPGNVAAQGVCLVDDQGRAYQPMTEATGRKIVRLLDKLLQIEAAANGCLYMPENTGPDADG